MKKHLYTAPLIEANLDTPLYIYILVLEANKIFLQETQSS